MGIFTACNAVLLVAGDFFCFIFSLFPWCCVEAGDVGSEWIDFLWRWLIKVTSVQISDTLNVWIFKETLSVALVEMALKSLQTF